MKEEEVEENRLQQRHVGGGMKEEDVEWKQATYFRVI